jgi:RNA polymerase sigma-70 factor (ECF subfamily)
MTEDHANNFEEHELAMLRLVRIKAAQLSRTNGFSPADRDDIRQELLLDCFVRLRKFDPAKSSHIIFLHKVVTNRLATLLEAQRAGCRDYRRCRHSLNDRVQFADESIELGETISVDDYEAQIGRRALSSVERTELQIDAASVISRLPAELAAVAVQLQSVSVVEAARRLQVSRSTLCRRVASLREIFLAVGLDRYVRQRSFQHPRGCARTASF